MRPIVVAFVVLLGFASPSAAVAAESDETLEVLTFNVWHGLRSGESKKRFPGEDAERMERRFQWQIEEIRRLDPDVLLFQEVNPNQRQARRYAEALGYDELHKVTSCGLHFGKIYKIPKNVNEGLAILARPELGLRGAGHKRLSGNAKCTASWGIQTKESRYVLFGEITVDGRKVLLATTHLASPPKVPEGFEDDLEALTRDEVLQEEQRDEINATLERKRARSLDEAGRLLAQIDKRRERLGGSEGRAPVVLGGDFNTGPGTPAIVALEEGGLTSLATGSAFLTWDPVRNQVNQEIGSKRSYSLPTFELTEIEELLEPERNRPRQIDFLFASEGLDPISAEMILDREMDGILPSDHFGILVTLRLEP
jgi:endonuclease/exonuclease/phosphatase family metal-dependent hydrolase